MPGARKDERGGTRAILELAAAAAAGRHRATAAACRRFLRRGGSPHAAAELFALLSAFCGWPTALAAFAALVEAAPGFRPRAMTRPRDRRAARREGWRRFRDVYGDLAPELHARIEGFDPSLGALLLEVPYGELYARPLLSMATKEAVACLLLALQVREPELRGHVRGARRCGLSEEELRGALRIAARRGSAPVRELIRRVLPGPAPRGPSDECRTDPSRARSATG
jgi:alkylhydroperoxidase/carboxymuconolactone decarboxylase family protein YurZ